MGVVSSIESEMVCFIVLLGDPCIRLHEPSVKYFNIGVDVPKLKNVSSDVQDPILTHIDTEKSLAAGISAGMSRIEHPS